MSELEQVDVTTEATPGAGAGQIEAGSEETTGETTALDLETQIEAAAAVREQAVRDEYEKKDGHLARLRSTKDKELATLKKQLHSAQQQKVERAKELLESNPDQAAAILMDLAEEQSTQIEQDGAHEKLVEWQHRILADLGADPDEDEEAATLALEWGPKLLRDPNLTWDFQQEAAKLQLSREREAAKEANKKLKDLEESLPETVKAEVTKALVTAGVMAAPTDEGGAPPSKDDWRNQSASQLTTQGLAERKKKPIKRT